MARRTPPNDSSAPAPQAGELPLVTPQSTIPGGAAGIPVNPGDKTAGMTGSTKIHYPPKPIEAAPPPEDAPKVRRYVVQNCPKPMNGGAPGFRYMRGGCLTFLLDGKVVDSNTYDVEDMKRQGIDLKDLGEF